MRAAGLAGHDSPEAAASHLFPNDAVAPILLRSAVSGATTTDPAWAGLLAQDALGDFVASLAPLSAAARLIEAGARVTLQGRSVAFPRRLGVPASDVAWAGEGVTPIPAATGDDAMVADLEALAGELADAGGSGSVVYVMAPRQAASAALRLVTNATLPIWPSAALDAGTVIAVDPLAFVSGFGAEPTIDASPDAVVVMDDGSPAHVGTPGSPNAVAAPTRSAFQTAVVVLRVLLDAAWAMRAPGLVAHVTDATWG